MNIQLISNQSDFAALKAPWRALNEQVGGSVFTNFDWCYQWWLSYHQTLDAKLCVLLAYQDHQLVALLPLYKRAQGLKGQQLAYIGTGGDVSPDYLQLLNNSGEDDQSVMRAMLAKVSGWDSLRLRNWFKPLDLGLTTLKERDFVIHKTDVGQGDWEDFLKTLSGNRRNRTRSTVKKWLNEPGHSMEVMPIAEVDTQLEQMIELHHQRWSKVTDEYSFRSKESQGFHRALVKTLAEQNQVVFVALKVNERPIAIFYCFRYQGVMSFFNCGIDKSYDAFKPGILLIIQCVMHLIDAGDQQFNFLKGDYQYKKLYANGEDVCSDYLVVNQGWLPKLRYYAFVKSRKLVKALIKKQD